MSVAKGPAILRRPGRYILVLIAVGLAVYANSLQGGHFIFDDESSIVNNFDIRQIWPLWRDADRITNPPVNNRPVVRLSLALNYALGELDVRGYWNSHDLVDNSLPQCEAASKASGLKPPR